MLLVGTYSVPTAMPRSGGHEHMPKFEPYTQTENALAKLNHANGL